MVQIITRHIKNLSNANFSKYLSNWPEMSKILFIMKFKFFMNLNKSACDIDDK